MTLKATRRSLRVAIALSLAGCPAEQIAPAPATSTTTEVAPAATTPAEPPLPPGPRSLPVLESMPSWGEALAWEGTLAEQNELLFAQLRHVHQLDGAQMQRVRAIFGESEMIGQGNPKPTRHPVSMAACLRRLREDNIEYRHADHERQCGGPYMAPLYDPATQKPADARACIDLFEYPNIPCVYPVTWVRSRAAAELCAATGKRICDAHEWEGACAGAVTPPDYDFHTVRFMRADDAVPLLRAAHNGRHAASPRWAYGPAYRKSVCGTSSEKNPGCDPVTWGGCGSNTFPAGYFPACRSPLGVLDLHGNAAEHMNLPLKPEQMASTGSRELGHTEMKGSWFVFDRIRAHEDHCRWRAPYWHGSRLMHEGSHHNYHLGFRCCKTVR